MTSFWEDTFIPALAANKPGYQPRPIQDKAAVFVETAFRNSQHSLCQLGCGTGKSYIAIANAYAQSLQTGQPTIVGTATKALQDQYATKDLPEAQVLLPDLRFAVIKGRSNYVCLAKVDEMNDTSLKQGAQEIMDKLGDEFSGEIADLGVDQSLYSNFSTSSDECPGKSECPFGEVCFAEKAKTKAKTAHIVVANHAVIAADVAVKNAQETMGVPEDKTVGLLPHWGGLIVDEAHELQDAITDALGGEITAGSYGRLGKEVEKLTNDRHATDKLRAKADDLFKVVRKIINTREDKRTTTLRLTDRNLAELLPTAKELAAEIARLTNEVRNLRIHGDDKAQQRRKRLVRRLENAQYRLLILVTAEDEQLVRWVEEAAKDGKKGDVIAWAPLDVSEFLTDNVWSKAPAMLMSATLSIPNKYGADFSYIQRQLGIEDSITMDGESPFDFAEQARILIPQLAVPSGATMNRWRQGSLIACEKLVRASDGRALLLFTSKTEMEAAYERIAPVVREMGHTPLKQGEAPNKVLSERFKDDEHSVLFALKSFMTGADFQGDTLRLVWINKLPFPVPTDVILQARVDLADKQYGKWDPRGGFNGVTVPLMALILLQGFGRGIRTINDHALIAIGDSRLYGKEAKNYGSKIMAALPKAPVLTDVNEACEWLESL